MRCQVNSRPLLCSPCSADAFSCDSSDLYWFFTRSFWTAACARRSALVVVGTYQGFPKYSATFLWQFLIQNRTTFYGRLTRFLGESKRRAFLAMFTALGKSRCIIPTFHPYETFHGGLLPKRTGPFLQRGAERTEMSYGGGLGGGPIRTTRSLLAKESRDER